MIEINMKKGKVQIPKAIILPPLGATVLGCRCGGTTFRNFVQVKNTEIVRIIEILCLTCKKTYRPDTKTGFDRRGSLQEDKDRMPGKIIVT